MIVEAELDPNTYIVDAIVTGRFYEDNYDKYYITYKIPLDNAEYTGDLYVAGYSFSVYDKEEIEQFSVGDLIDVAIDTPGVFTYTDSVPMDYKDMPIEKDGEYQKAASTQRVLRTIFLSAIVLGVGWVIVFIVLTKKAEKEYVKAHPVNASVVKKADAANYCEYCGTYMVRDNNPKCPACGAVKKL